MTVRNEALHAQIIESRRSGHSYRVIAEAHGISAQRVQQILNPYNANKSPITYNCKACGAVWETMTKTRPNRCKTCGTHYWNRQVKVEAESSAD